jgi:hypothetical protein
MKPWLERTDGQGPRTHTLVIGVSQYDFLPDEGEPERTDRETFGLRQAKTPATSAWNFANWLKDSYNNPNAPLGTVRLLLSPSEWERETIAVLSALPVEVLPATRENVEEAVGDWHDAASTDADNVAILYASGHGIQVSKDDGGIVLLQDFAKLKNSVLTHSLDVPAVRKGMAGQTMAQQQFYFVDACQVRPKEAVDYQNMGNGVALQNPFEGAPLVSAIYFSASPSTEALGEPGQGTLFGQALLKCLELEAVDNHVHENDWWVVTSGTLMRALPPLVSDLAREFDYEQSAVAGGQLVDVIFHVLPERPKVPVTLELDPEEAAACVLARLSDGRKKTLFRNKRFEPTITTTLPAGNYLLKVRINPPTPEYSFSGTDVIPALPPECRKTVSVRA